MSEAEKKEEAKAADSKPTEEKSGQVAKKEEKKPQVLAELGQAELSTALVPRSLAEASFLAEKLAQSDVVPKDFKGKAGNILVAIMMGQEVGLKPMQALQNIAVINGRPSLFGDAIPALLFSNPLVGKFEEADDEEIAKTGVAWCKITRADNGYTKKVSFSEEDAVRAKLIGKAGPWTEYPRRMKMFRARAFAARDVVPDVLKGLAIYEEQQDVHYDAETTASRVPPAPTEAKSSTSSPAPAPAAGAASASSEAPPNTGDTIDNKQISHFWGQYFKPTGTHDRNDVEPVRNFLRDVLKVPEPYSLKDVKAADLPKLLDFAHGKYSSSGDSTQTSGGGAPDFS